MTVLLAIETHGHGDHHTSVSVLKYLGALQRRQGRLEEASSTLEHVRAMVGHGDLDMLASVSHEQGLVLRDQGRHDEAVQMLRSALSARRRMGQGDHPETQETVTALRELLSEMGRETEAAELEGEAAGKSEVSS